jgi:hypothetical protein
MKFAELRDWFYPTMDPPTAEQVCRTSARENALLAAAEAHPDSKAVAQAYTELLANETERLKSVEARLSGILSLTSITASLLVGGMFVLLNGGLSDSSLWLRVTAAAALLYLNLQVVCSTLATICGMSRATWDYPSIDDLLPPSSISPQEFNRQIALNNCRRLLGAERNINDKVTQMAIAHRAIRNFAAGSALIAVLGFAAVGLQRPGSAAAKAIRNDPGIQKLLTGPQGPPGPAGPKGEPGQSASPMHK